MKVVFLALALSVGSFAQAAQCFRTDVNGGEVEGLDGKLTYSLVIQLPGVSETGRMTFYVGRNSIAGSRIYRDSDTEFGIEGLPGRLFRVSREDGMVWLKINGSNLGVNWASGEIELKRKRGASRVYGLEAASGVGCR